MLTINYKNKRWEPKSKQVFNLDLDQIYAYRNVCNTKTNFSQVMPSLTKTVSVRITLLLTNNSYIYNCLCLQKLEQNTDNSQTQYFSKEWLLPQFIFMAFGETLFTMTGLAFSYTEVNIIINTVTVFLFKYNIILIKLLTTVVLLLVF